eukprot:scaffold227_cov236-Chaetoceros_neogracile.AAC.2
MSVPHTVLKVLIAYYVVQILYVHYHTYKLQNIPPPTPMNNETVTVVNKKNIFQTRDYLTQEQLFLIQESVKESFDHNDLPDVSNYPVKLLTEEFNDNLRTINALSANVKAAIDENPLPDAPRKEINDDEDQEIIHLTDLAAFLSKTSFAEYTDDELGFIDFSVVDDGLSSLEHYNIHLGDLPKKSATTDEMERCDEFMTRTMTASRKKRFETKEVFVSFLDSVRLSIEDLKMNPLNDESRAIVSDRFSIEGQTMFDAIQNEVDSLVQDLKDIAAEDLDITDEQEESEPKQCIDKEKFHDFLEAGITAHNERQNVYDALSGLVDGLDATIIMEEFESPDKYVDNEALTLKDLLSFPLYSKLIDKIDSTVDFIGGYNEAVDRLIDTIGGNEDGGIGKNLEKILNRLTAKVEVPKKYQELQKKAGVTR